MFNPRKQIVLRGKKGKAAFLQILHTKPSKTPIMTEKEKTEFEAVFSKILADYKK